MDYRHADNPEPFTKYRKDNGLISTPNENPAVTVGLDVLTPIEIEELIRYHTGSAMFGCMMSDDFKGEQYHRMRAEKLRSLLPSNDS